jgi:uncharacterized membrane protein
LEVVLGITAMFVATLIFISWQNRKSNKSNKSKAKKAMGAGLFAIDEVFHPSAHESSIILEEKREERKALPSPEDKENPAQ